MTFVSSLTNRIFLASAALAVLSIGVAVLVVNAAVTSQAERELARGLEEAAALVDEYRTTLFEHSSREARLVADLPRFKATVDLDDPPTLAPVAEEYRRQIGADLFVVTGRAGRVLAQVGTVAGDDLSAAARGAIREAVAGREATSFWSHPGGVLQVVSVPIWIDPAQPQILGTLSVGFSLDLRMAERFKALTNSEIVFALDRRILVSTLPSAVSGLLAGLLESRDVRTARLGDDEYVAVTRSLVVPQSAGGTEAGVPPMLDADTSRAPTAIILRSRTERLRFLRSLHTQLAATALVALFAATLLSYGIARTVTRPLGAITATMREMSATGDLTRRIPTAQATTWQDEDARLLAATFNAMTESIARFQRDAAQRERLSALGRLSTVIAHEIRNPLMIIKASLRTLKRDDARPDQVQASVADVEEEVARLNRIVSEVLDFARPISFEFAPADLNEVCRSAARAVATEGGAAPIHLALDARLPPVVTDAERLRLALVNVLTNAQQAVEGRQPPHAASTGVEPRVELRTAAGGDRRVRVTVRDNGPGITPDDLPRVFEPYFTTKRTGSGLGLAITKNIVEGLGGAVAARSRPGEGTEIEFDLPLERRP